MILTKPLLGGVGLRHPDCWGRNRKPYNVSETPGSGWLMDIKCQNDTLYEDKGEENLCPSLWHKGQGGWVPAAHTAGAMLWPVHQPGPCWAWAGRAGEAAARAWAASRSDGPAPSLHQFLAALTLSGNQVRRWIWVTPDGWLGSLLRCVSGKLQPGGGQWARQPPPCIPGLGHPGYDRDWGEFEELMSRFQVSFLTLF